MPFPAVSGNAVTGLSVTQAVVLQKQHSTPISSESVEVLL